MKLKKTTLSDVLKTFGRTPSDFGSAVVRASDGYAIEIPGEMLWKKDVVLVFEADDEKLSLRVYVRRERAMYCVRDAVALTLLPKAEEAAVQGVLFFDTAVQALEQEPYEAYGETAQAVRAADFLARYFDEKPDFIRAEMADGLVKREQYAVFDRGYLKLTGKHALQFTAPDLPAGMRMKGIETLRVGRKTAVSLRMVLEKSGTPELSGKDFLERELPESDHFILMARDGSQSEIDRQSLLRARFYQGADGAVDCVAEGRRISGVLELKREDALPRDEKAPEPSSGKALVLRLEPAPPIEIFGIIVGRSSVHYMAGNLYEKAGTVDFYPQWDSENRLCGITAGAVVPDDIFGIEISESSAVGIDGSVFDMGGRPLELRGNAVFGRRPDNTLCEIVGVFINAPSISVTATAWDALECLKNDERIMIIELDGFGLNIYREALSQNKLPFLSKQPMSPAMTVFRPVSHSGLAAMLTGTTPEVNGIHDRKGRNLLVPDLFERCRAMGKTCAYIEGYSKLINTSEEPVLNPSRGGETTDNAVFESALKALEKQPDLIFIHFHGIDDDATTYGPYASETAERVQKNDSLVQRLAERWPGEIIITADHGLHHERGCDSRGTHGIFCAEDMLVPYIHIKKDVKP